VYDHWLKQVFGGINLIMVRQLLLKIFEFNKRPSHAAFRAYSGATLLGEYLSMAIATII